MHILLFLEVVLAELTRATAISQFGDGKLGKRKVEEKSVDQRRRHYFGFSMGVSVGQTRRHFLAIQKKPDRMAKKPWLPYNVEEKRGETA